MAASSAIMPLAPAGTRRDRGRSPAALHDFDQPLCGTASWNFCRPGSRHPAKAGIGTGVANIELATVRV